MKIIIKYLAFLLLSISVILSCSEDGIDENGRGELTGTVVTSGDNLPLANVKITTSPASNTVFTNSQGTFTIEQVPTGEYSVQAQLDDYVTAFEAANILDGLTTNVVFEMQLSSQDNLPPLAPVLLTPADNETEVGTEVEFVWNSSNNDDDEIIYSFELRNGQTNEIVITESLADTTYAMSGLELGVNYFWQVSADDDVNPIVESAISGFTTKDPNLNRFFYVKKMGNNNVIYSGTDGGDGTMNENEIQLTPLDANSFRPRRNQTSDKIAFLRTVGADTHLFTMNVDGSETDQVTSSIPVVGFRQDEVDFTWHQNGQKLYYPNLNKLYSINATGSGNTLIFQAAAGVFITEVDVNESNNLVAIKTNDANGYNARIFILDPNTDLEVDVVIENEAGALGGIDYSIDGTKVLYTRDISGFENGDYRRLDSRLFIHNLLDDTTVELSLDKPAGTNDLDAKYAPNEGSVIFMNTSNDGVSTKNIYRILLDDTNNRELLFTNAFMPDWE